MSDSAQREWRFYIMETDEYPEDGHKETEGIAAKTPGSVGVVSE